jgi:hypothetical protein
MKKIRRTKKMPKNAKWVATDEDGTKVWFISR